MKKLLTALVLTTALAMPTTAMAKTLTFSVTMKSYRGPGAYLAMYITDSHNNFKGTVFIAGGKSRYYRHLPNWYRATGGSLGAASGSTGASVGSGRKLEFSFNLSDALIDAGYQLHIDSAVENGREVANDIVVNLNSSNMGNATRGKRYVSSFTFR